MAVIKWNIEWIDLQNIEHMIAECWRMNDKQLDKYYRKLSIRRDLVFAGTIGTAFLELMHGIMTGEADYDWSKLQKDVHMLQKLIQDGLERDEIFWKEQYQEIMDEPSFYFYTDLGKAFTDQLAVKLELNLTQEQKILRQDLKMIEQICSVCDFNKESDVKKALSILDRGEKNYFSSWLGESFINTVQEQFIKKEEPPQLPPEPVPEPEPVSRPGFRGRSRSGKIRKTVKSIFLSLPFLFLCAGIWTGFRQGYEPFAYLRQLCSSVQVIPMGQKTGADQKNNMSRQDNDYQSEQQNPDNHKVHPLDMAVESDVSGKDASRAIEDSVDEEKIQDPAEDERSGREIQTTDKSGGVSGQEETVKLDKNTGAVSGEADTGRQSVDTPDILPGYRSFYKEYPDLFGWLHIPDTDINVPVMQSDDAEKGEKYYYLHRDYAGNPSEEGSLFVDTSSSCYPQDQNTVIYGHNMSNGRIFGTLDQFTCYDFFKEHQNIRYDTIYEKGYYRIVAVLKTRILYQDEEGFRYYRFFNYHTKKEFQECQQFVKKNQLFDSGKELQYGDQILMLSTCEYSRENGRLVIVAKRVER